jgi:hypothetical protein
MHGKKKQHKAPAKWATRVAKPSQVEFNLAKMVFNYAVLKRLMGLFESSKNEQGETLYPDSATFFSGMLKGYDDWFDALGILQDKFDEAVSKLNKQKMRAEADAVFVRIVEAKQKQNVQKVVLPSEYSHKQIEQAKKLFDEHLNK